MSELQHLDKLNDLTYKLDRCLTKLNELEIDFARMQEREQSAMRTIRVLAVALAISISTSVGCAMYLITH